MEKYWERGQVCIEDVYCVKIEVFFKEEIMLSLVFLNIEKSDNFA